MNGASRWAGMTKAARSKEMKRVRAAFGVCVEIAAQCYGYVASSEMARKDKAVIELAEDLHESHALGKLRAEADRLRTALQAVADEAGQHYEHNPISGVDRLPLGYTKILNLADTSLNPPNAVHEPQARQKTPDESSL